MKFVTNIKQFQVLYLENQNPLSVLSMLVGTEIWFRYVVKRDKSLVPVRNLTSVSLLPSLQPFTIPTQLSRLVVLVLVVMVMVVTAVILVIIVENFIVYI
jgi:hypothetical protein